eukprot:1078064-Pelagomonas_calceolata.AAC.1
MSLNCCTVVLVGLHDSMGQRFSRNAASSKRTGRSPCVLLMCFIWISSSCARIVDPESWIPACHQNVHFHSSLFLASLHFGPGALPTDFLTSLWLQKGETISQADQVVVGMPAGNKL